MLPKKMPTKVATRPPKPPTPKSREAGTEEKFRAAIGKAAGEFTALVEKAAADAKATGKPKKPAVKQTRADGRVKSKLTIAAEEAALAAKRGLLLSTLNANNWNFARTAEALDLPGTPGVIRALKESAPDEYERARKDGRVAPGKRN